MTSFVLYSQTDGSRCLQLHRCKPACPVQHRRLSGANPYYRRNIGWQDMQGNWSHLDPNRKHQGGMRSQVLCLGTNEVKTNMITYLGGITRNKFEIWDQMALLKALLKDGSRNSNHLELAKDDWDETSFSRTWSGCPRAPVPESHYLASQTEVLLVENLGVDISRITVSANELW